MKPGPNAQNAVIPGNPRAPITVESVRNAFTKLFNYNSDGPSLHLDK